MSLASQATIQTSLDDVERNQYFSDAALSGLDHQLLDHQPLIMCITDSRPDLQRYTHNSKSVESHGSSVWEKKKFWPFMAISIHPACLIMSRTMPRQISAG